MTQKKNKFVSEKTLSTQSVILERSLELINEQGLMNFRIEALSESLKLSPGNISYHFSKKEFIASILWYRFLGEFVAIIETVSAILDIKQTFLAFRELCIITYKYRGVVMFVSSDNRVIRDSEYLKEDFHEITTNLFSNIKRHLHKNGYLQNGLKDSIELDSQTLLIRWWINKALLENCKEHLTKEQVINHNALLLLFSFYENMNKKGREEFEFIAEKVYADEV